MTRPILSYTVAPSIPKELQCLQSIAYNLLWVWDHELMELFMRIDLDLWELTNHNPVQMLGMIRQERLNSLMRYDAYLAQVERAYRRFTEYQGNGSSWFLKTHPGEKNACFAY